MTETKGTGTGGKAVPRFREEEKKMKMKWIRRILPVLLAILLLPVPPAGANVHNHTWEFSWEWTDTIEEGRVAIVTEKCSGCSTKNTVDSVPLDNWVDELTYNPATGKVDYSYTATSTKPASDGSYPSCTLSGSAEPSVINLIFYWLSADGKLLAGRTNDFPADQAETLTYPNDAPLPDQTINCHYIFNGWGSLQVKSGVNTLGVILDVINAPRFSVNVIYSRRAQYTADLTHVEAVPATCTAPGNEEYWKCDDCGKMYSDAAGENVITAIPTLEINPDAHTWGEWGSPVWADDYSKCTMTRKCTLNPNHTDTITSVRVTSEVTKESTCTEMGQTTYTAEFDSASGIANQTTTVTNVALLEHSWNPWQISEETHTRACKNCEATETGSHVWGEWVSVDPYNHKRNCTVCGEAYQEEPHTFVNGVCSVCGRACSHETPESHEAVAPTCTTDGNTKYHPVGSGPAYWSCPDCGKFFSDAEGTKEIAENSWVVEAWGHDWDEENWSVTEDNTQHYHICTNENCSEKTAFGNHTGGKATCVAPAVCEVCGNEYGSPDPSAHPQLTATPAQDPACTEPGNSAYWYCPDCKKYFSDAEGTKEIEKDSWILPADGHKLTATPAKDPTCTEPGNSAYWTCSVCGLFFSDAEGTTEIEKDSWILPPVPHQLGEWDSDGDETHTRSCENCDYSETANHTWIPKYDRSSHWEECSECGAATVKASHTLKYETTETTHWQFCADECGYYATEEPAAHRWVSKSDGEKHWQECECGLIRNEEAHHGGTVTCTGKPSCEVCGTEYGEPDPSAHPQLTAFPAKEATAEADGNTAYWYCPECEKYFSDAEGTHEIAEGSWIIPKHVHTLAPTPAKDPTCTEPGSSAYWTCSACGLFFSDAEGKTAVTEGSWILPPAGHTEVIDPAVPATCAVEGKTEGSHCAVCGIVIREQKPAMVAHTAETLEGLDPTCTEPGLTAEIRCAVCGEVLSEAEEIPKLGHSMEDWTPDGAGSHSALCRRCRYAASVPCTMTELPREAGAEPVSFCPVCGACTGAEDMVPVSRVLVSGEHPQAHLRVFILEAGSAKYMILCYEVDGKPVQPEGKITFLLPAEYAGASFALVAADASETELQLSGNADAPALTLDFAPEGEEAVTVLILRIRQS